MNGFVKLYGTILTSSIWLESDTTLRVWIAMLATADEDGVVAASVGGLAHVSRVSRKACLRTLEILKAPDPDSRTKTDDGRRIEVVDGGWRIINHGKYRDLRTKRQRDDAARQQRHREGVTERDSHEASHSSQSVAIEAEADVEVLPPPPLARVNGAQSPNGSTAQTLVSVVPAEFRPDMQSLLVLVPNVTAWTAEMRAALEGMHGKPLSGPQLGQAVRDYLASGKAKSNPSLRSFRRYMQGVLEVNGPAPLTFGKRKGPPEYDYTKTTDSPEAIKWAK